MELDFLGHASLLVRMDGCSLLFDPLLFGVHHEGLYDVYPPRELNLAGMPPFDAIVISHGHLDHFDLASLAALPRARPIFAPADTVVLGCLQGLGFSNLFELRNFETVRFGDVQLTPTPGSDGAVEHGFVLTSGGATIWHLVDTVPSEANIERVKAAFPCIDVAIVPWQPLLDAAGPCGAPLAFPYGAYSQLINNVIQIDARAIVPGACGFQAVGSGEWTNRAIFPVTRTRFVEDVRRAKPRTSFSLFECDPGDLVSVTQKDVSHRRRALAYCLAGEYGWQKLRFRPHDPMFSVGEHRGASFDEGTIRPALDTFFAEVLPAFLTRERSRFAWHRRWCHRHEVEVVFADARTYYTIDFCGEDGEVREGRSPLSGASSIITAGALTGLIADTVSWEYAISSGEYRYYQGVYLVDETGIRAPPAGRIRDPLEIAFADSASRERCLTWQVERLSNCLSPT